MADSSNYDKKVTDLEKEIKNNKMGLYVAVILCLLIDLTAPAINKYIEKNSGQKPIKVFPTDALLYRSILIPDNKSDTSTYIDNDRP